MKGGLENRLLRSKIPWEPVGQVSCGEERGKKKKKGHRTMCSHSLSLRTTYSWLQAIVGSSVPLLQQQWFRFGIRYRDDIDVLGELMVHERGWGFWNFRCGKTGMTVFN
ncbi:hypothetical protein CEXT_13401 [Caerostris extrusa]|uniref:Uncharacterized protein n=1 Tax=Caerostris extrusa TaxID=172846 RepID=A0AAV4YD08_CAEEX|nr:hypothetical protein CEXT_13401 [Caerostris extrusa]